MLGIILTGHGGFASGLEQAMKQILGEQPQFIAIDFPESSTTARLTAQLADPVLAVALAVRPGAPVLRTVAVNVDPGGVPVELGTTWFAGERVTLTVADQP